ncbi:MAG: FAD binding domain-containing protein [Chloroflexi bacterium]|nr:FAD binding domain-containing protein [Chloroflexota bacterium]
MPRFEYAEPRTVAEAVEALVAYGAGARVLAGGTDLLIQMRERGLRPAAVVNLKRIPGLAGIAEMSGGGVRIGACTTMGEIAESPIVRSRYPALAAGAGMIGSVQIRNLATIGGNIANASPAADSAPALLLYEAVVRIAGPAGERSVPLVAFFLGPGRSALQPGEIVTGFALAPPPAGSQSVYFRLTTRKAMDLAFVGVGALVARTNGVIAEARLALGAVAPTPLRARQTEAFLRGQPPLAEVLAEAGRMAADESRPITDLRASLDYRRQMVETLTARLLRQVAGAQ